MSGHGGNLRAASELYGFGEGEFLDFSSNINPLGLPKALADALHESIDRSLTAYPDPDCVQLREAISRFDSVPFENILCGNGASELIQLAFDTIRPKHTLLLTPGFYDYERSATLAGSELIFFDLRAEDQWQANLDELESMIDKLDEGDVLITGQPNNPSSTLWDIKDLEKLAEKCCGRGIFLLVDEAFLHLTIEGESLSLKNELEKFPGLLLFRAFTKYLAVPGLRLGYAFACTELLNRMKHRQISWSVSALAQSIAPALDKIDKYRADTRAWLETELDSHFDELKRFEMLTPYHASTNFLLARLNGSLDAKGLADKMARRGILLRNASNFRGLDDYYVRFAVKSHDENIRLYEELRKVL